MANKQKPLVMTADEFVEFQHDLGLGNADMAAGLHRSERQIRNYRVDGVCDQLVADRVLFLVAENAANLNGDRCVAGCGTVAEPGKPYCKACEQERRTM